MLQGYESAGIQREPRRTQGNPVPAFACAALAFAFQACIGRFLVASVVTPVRLQLMASPPDARPYAEISPGGPNRLEIRTNPRPRCAAGFHKVSSARLFSEKYTKQNLDLLGKYLHTHCVPSLGGPAHGN